ncbi:MAG: APC family permease, partial [Deltaproteobacteria bacterium]
MTQLLKSLSFIDAFSIVVGSMIGTGVFLKSATMAQWAGSVPLVLLAWCVAGLLSIAGAVSYTEMGRRYPKAGGEYVYLRESYGALPAFLFGWTRFWIASTGSVAAYGVGAATFLSGVMPLDTLGGKTGVALGFIAAFSLANCFTVALGGKIQALMTIIKISLMVSLIIGLGFVSGAVSEGHFSYPGNAQTQNSFSSFGMAVLAALWAFDGWNNLPMAAGEVKDSTRVVPLALVSGTLVVLGLYLGVNLVFFKALSFSEVATANSALYPNAPSVAAKAVARFAGEKSSMIVSCFFVFSALGAMNGSILTGARVPYAMAQDGLFFSAFGKVHSTTFVPVISVVLQGLWAMCLAGSGTFDQITDYVIFSSWIFYSAIAFAVFRVSKKMRAIPLLFSVCGLALLVNTMIS